jgi:hypothetical protein
MGDNMRFPFSAVTVVMAVCLLSYGAAAGKPLPTADAIIQRMLDRSAELAKCTETNHWTYDKKTLSEELDSDGKVEKKKEKLYRVKIIKGVPFSRLVKISGRDLTEAELKKENQREAEFRKKISGRDPEAMSEREDPLIEKELVERYRFEVVQRETVKSRDTIQVKFGPKPGKLEEKTVQDRILNRMAGTLWIDEATGEVAKLNVGLTKGFSLGVFGMLGSVKDCQVSLSSKAMPDGAWVPESTDIRITARMLLSAARYHVREECSNYRLEPQE